MFYFSCRKRFRLTVSHTTAADEANINTIGMITLVLSPVCTALSDEAVTVSAVSGPDVSAGSEESVGSEGSEGSEGSAGSEGSEGLEGSEGSEGSSIGPA